MIKEDANRANAKVLSCNSQRKCRGASLCSDNAEDNLGMRTSCNDSKAECPGWYGGY